jgi:hypothetical protein
VTCGIIKLLTDYYSSRRLCARVSAAGVHHVASNFATHSAAKITYPGFQHRHVDEDTGLARWRSSNEHPLGLRDQDWWNWVRTALFCVCCEYTPCCTSIADGGIVHISHSWTCLETPEPTLYGS